MLSGNFPCCGGILFMALAKDVQLPLWEKHACPHCHTPIWTKHSRFDSISYTDEEFRKYFIIDEENKKITERKGIQNAT